MNKAANLIIGIVILAAIIVGAVYFATRSNTTNQPSGQTPATSTNNNRAIKEFTIEAKPFSFTPNEIRVSQGDRVRVILNNIEGNHDWVLDEFSARTNIISAGQTATVEFTADKIGTFEFYCSVANHRQMGMRGNLIVE